MQILDQLIDQYALVQTNLIVVACIWLILLGHIRSRLVPAFRFIPWQILHQLLFNLLLAIVDQVYDVYRKILVD